MSLENKRQPGAFKLILWLWQEHLTMFLGFETMLGSETLCGHTVERLTDYGLECIWQTAARA